ncbi:MAG: pseudouridylate synthase [Sphingobacteriales bacterium]|nr:MAG: pseudouridylate synthase [Sphingobacteriales bacterium]
MAQLQVLYSDDHLIAVNKLNGLLVHKTRIAKDANEFALQFVRNQTRRTVFPVHRLDRGTSGVLLFAFSDQIHSLLSQTFQKRMVVKYYLAIVRGYTDETGTINYPLSKEKTGKEQEALTKFERINTVELPFPVGKYRTARYSLVKVIPYTGRMHQIRRHFNYISHPVIGDLPHGDYRHNHFFRDKLDCPYLMLHSYSLKFLHPVFNKEMEIKAPILEPMAKIIQRFGWEFNV